MARFILLVFIIIAPHLRAQTEAIRSIPLDSRFKTDILIVVAHPDDETALGPLLAKMIFDQKKSVAIVYCNRGTGGGNTRGNEQAAAMGSIREIEARRAAAAFGIDRVWFLTGRDTPGQDLLRSLQEWHHGAILEEVVRLLRLTRPEIVLTWLPHFVAGENHGDHQAAGVIATEAFDLAGNPTVFPAQVTPPRERADVGNATEGLQPWQSKKIYFFSDASHPISGEGPAFDPAAVSPTKKVPYIEIAAELSLPHETQGEVSAPAREALAHKEFGTFLQYHERFRLIFGKSLVRCSPKGDLFEGITSQPVPYAAPPGYSRPAGSPRALDLGGVFAFYRDFWPSHGIERVADLVPPEIEVAAGSYLHVPLLLRNTSADSCTIVVTPNLPAGWDEVAGRGAYRLAPGEEFPVQTLVRTPGSPVNSERAVRWEASLNGRTLGTIGLTVITVEWALPQ